MALGGGQLGRIGRKWKGKRTEFRSCGRQNYLLPIKKFGASDLQKKWQEELSKIDASQVDVSSAAKGEVSVQDKKDIVDLLKSGLSCAEIAIDLGKSETTITNWRTKLLGDEWRPKPAYERKNIPYEFETQVKMLSWSWGHSSMDESRGETEQSYHDTLPSTYRTPLEELMEQEDEVAGLDFYQWVKAWIWDLTPNAARIAKNILDGDPVTDEEKSIVKAEALLLFKKPQ